MPQEKNIHQFNEDVKTNEGYLYSSTDRLSCRIANRRLSEAVRAMADITGKRVIDIGCGDGTYSMELLAAKPASLLGVDAAEVAVGIAAQKAEGLDNVKFMVGDVYALDKLNDHFDVAIVRGVLHHLNDAAKAIKSIVTVADEVVIIEPNGYNPALKIIEKTSRYHIEHEEKSYCPHTLDQWFADCGFQVVKAAYCGLVPMFCPDWMAKALKAIEPLIEQTPILRSLGCAVYVMKLQKR